MKRVIVSWSSGKDSALTLARMLESTDCKVVGLMTTYQADNGQVPIQTVPIEAVRAQASACGLPLLEVPLPGEPANGVYQQAIISALDSWHIKADALAFGDMYCNGIIEFRQGFLEPAGYQCLFPLMEQPPAELAREIIARGIQTFLCSVDCRQLDPGFCGREYDAGLLQELPEGIDPCGEVGEFHTFVYNAPYFNKQLLLKRGEPQRHVYRQSRSVELMVLPFSVSE